MILFPFELDPEAGPDRTHRGDAEGREIGPGPVAHIRHVRGLIALLDEADVAIGL